MKSKNKYENRFTRWHLFGISINFLLLIGALFTFYFIHQNINIAVANAQAISNIKSSPTFDVLDLQTYEKIKKIIDAKKNAKPFSNKVRNIFIYDKSISSGAKTAVGAMQAITSSTTTQTTSSETTK